MKKLVVLLALAAASAFAAEVNGFIADSNCGAKHAAGTAADAKCSQGCIKKGAAAVLVTKDGTVYKIADDSQAKAKAFAGKTVSVNGSVEGDTLTISSIQ
ncbi:MAG TPA: DUF5818 domain-containing protein [Bryobacteraceae bacterium]|jgi:hypothetical protein|nr:DUF5818 domain-containing protein [Bryobacteraceae bacterium]